MSFIAQNNYSKQDLEACADGNLFTKEGDGRLTISIENQPLDKTNGHKISGITD